MNSLYNLVKVIHIIALHESNEDKQRYWVMGTTNNWLWRMLVLKSPPHFLCLEKGQRKKIGKGIRFVSSQY